MAFDKNFVWGTATSSYQIEGGGLDYGRGECIWHRFSHTPGNVYQDQHGDVANDHIHRYKEDVALMKTLGVDAYRFSIAWARVIPQGTGDSNEQGLDFYDRLVDELIGAGITPYITLYHWDLPQALQDRGGWENPESVQWFADYTELVAKRLGDRVKHWITHNEPYVASFVGNQIGRHAPGQKNVNAAYKVAHHILLSHGAAVRKLREIIPDAQVGITLDLNVVYPASDSEADKAAADRFDAYHNLWFLEPVFNGVYPQSLVDYITPKGALEGINLDEISAAKVPIDFLGVNYYRRENLAAGSDDTLLDVKHVRRDDKHHTGMNWEVYPEGLKEVMLHLHKTYQPKAIYITENGCAYDDPEPENGVVADPLRVDYYASHLDALEQAHTEGAPIAGYFAWSFMDNFEWAEGYAKRFGIHYVNYETQERLPKQSALYYRDRIQETKQRG